MSKFMSFCKFRLWAVEWGKSEGVCPSPQACPVLQNEQIPGYREFIKVLEESCNCTSPVSPVTLGWEAAEGDADVRRVRGSINSLQANKRTGFVNILFLEHFFFQKHPGLLTPSLKLKPAHWGCLFPGKPTQPHPEVFPGLDVCCGWFLTRKCFFPL